MTLNVMEKISKNYQHLSRQILALILLLALNVAYASVERITQYEYDGAGNIIGIIYQEQTDPPSIDSLSPGYINQGTAREIIVTGNNLLAIDVFSDTAGLTISDVQATQNQVIFSLNASVDAPIGEAQLRFTTGIGNILRPINIEPVPPLFNTNPSPIIIAGNNVNTTITLTFTEPRPTAETYTLNIADPAIATSASTFTIAQGARTATLVLTGLERGTTTLTLEAVAQQQYYSLPVRVEKSFAEHLEEFPDTRQQSLFSQRVGVNVQSPPKPIVSRSYSAAVGVRVQTSPESLVSRTYSTPVGVNRTPAPSIINSTNYSASVGAIVGPQLNTQPTITASLNSSVTLELTGVNLAEAQSLTFSPEHDIAVGEFSVNPEGTQLTIPLTIGPGTNLGTYEITLNSASGVIASSNGLPLNLRIEQ